MREVHKVQVLLLFVLVDEAWFEQSGLGVGGRKKVGRVEGVGRHGEKKVLTRNLSCP